MNDEELESKINCYVNTTLVKTIIELSKRLNISGEETIKIVRKMNKRKW
jgi:hypothetical protein